MTRTRNMEYPPSQTSSPLHSPSVRKALSRQSHYPPSAFPLLNEPNTPSPMTLTRPRGHDNPPPHDPAGLNVAPEDSGRSKDAGLTQNLSGHIIQASTVIPDQPYIQPRSNGVHAGHAPSKDMTTRVYSAIPTPPQAAELKRHHEDHLDYIRESQHKHRRHSAGSSVHPGAGEHPHYSASSSIPSVQRGLVPEKRELEGCRQIEGENKRTKEYDLKESRASTPSRRLTRSQQAPAFFEPEANFEAQGTKDSRETAQEDFMQGQIGEAPIQLAYPDTIEGFDDQAAEEDLGEMDEGDEDDRVEHVPGYVMREMLAFEQGFNGLQGRFKLLDKIGEGTFSSVYKAEDLEHDQYDNSPWDYGLDDEPRKTTDGDEYVGEEKKEENSEGIKIVALKRIYVTSSPIRIENEIAILHDLSGHKNVVPLITAFRFRDQVIVALPYFEHRDFRDYFRTLPMDDIRWYFRALIKGLAHVHKHKIIHRDVKPSNFLYDTSKKTGVLVDFGLAQREEDGPMYRTSSRSSSRYTSHAGTSSRHEVSKSGTANAATSKPPLSKAEIHRTDIAPTKTPAPEQRQSLTRKSAIISVEKENSTSTRYKLPGESASPAKPTTPSATTTSKFPVVVAQQPATSKVRLTTPGTTSYGLPTVPPSQMPSLVNNVRPKPQAAMAPPSTANPHTSVLSANREPGYLKKDSRPTIRVNRAGTRGFRAPEVLFKHTRQTVALDMWSVGVILLSFLTGRFPFFNSNDDVEALLEISVIFGSREMSKVARTFNRSFITNIPTVKEGGVQLIRLCRILHPTRFAAPEGYISKSAPRIRQYLPPPQALDKSKLLQGSANAQQRPQQISSTSSRTLPPVSRTIAMEPHLVHKPSLSQQPTLLGLSRKPVSLGQEQRVVLPAGQDQRPTIVDQEQRSVLPVQEHRTTFPGQEKCSTLPGQEQAPTLLEQRPTLLGQDPRPVLHGQDQPIFRPAPTMTSPPPKVDTDGTVKIRSKTQLDLGMVPNGSSAGFKSGVLRMNDNRDLPLHRLFQPDPATPKGYVMTGEKARVKGSHRSDASASSSPGWDKQEDLELAVSLLEKLLALDPTRRITADEALEHPFLR